MLFLIFCSPRQPFILPCMLQPGRTRYCKNQFTASVHSYFMTLTVVMWEGTKQSPFPGYAMLLGNHKFSLTKLSKCLYFLDDKTLFICIIAVWIFILYELPVPWLNMNSLESLMAFISRRLTLQCEFWSRFLGLWLDPCELVSCIPTYSWSHSELCQ